MDRLAALRVFVAVAEAGSLSAAARKLGMPLSTVSRQLKALEDELDTRLITRTTRRLVLTESGRSYAATCRQVLDELDDAGRRVAGEQAEPRGELALTAPVVFGRLHVLPIVAQFLNAFPRVAARMLLVATSIWLKRASMSACVSARSRTRRSARRASARSA
jgi:DNA-binding transcriptional LysR family regulator